MPDIDLAESQRNLNDLAVGKKGLTKTASVSIQLTNKTEKNTRERRNLIIYEIKYSRMDQVKFMRYSL